MLKEIKKSLKKLFSKKKPKKIIKGKELGEFLDIIKV